MRNIILFFLLAVNLSSLRAEESLRALYQTYKFPDEIVAAKDALGNCTRRGIKRHLTSDETVGNIVNKGDSKVAEIFGTVTRSWIPYLEEELAKFNTQVLNYLATSKYKQNKQAACKDTVDDFGFYLTQRGALSQVEAPKVTERDIFKDIIPKMNSLCNRFAVIQTNGADSGSIEPNRHK